MTTKNETETQAAPTVNPAVEKYLTTGAHIGTRFKSGDMGRYIYKQRKDGLKVLDVQVIDERVKMVGQFLAKYSPKSIVVVSRKVYGKTPAEEFAKAIGAQSMTGRFVPGTFTNPQGKEFVQPSVVVVTEPESDAQAIIEAARAHAVVVALASTNNLLTNVDIVIPVNNKGRKSLALIYWMLTKEFLKATGDLKSDEAFTRTIDEFEYPLKEGETEDQGMKRKRKGRPFDRGGRGGDDGPSFNRHRE